MGRQCWKFRQVVEPWIQRVFIMVTILLIGVMLDRPALTSCALAVAAVSVLLLSPQAVVHPSFKISYKAALALDRGLSIWLAGRRILARQCWYFARGAGEPARSPRPDLFVARDDRAAAIRGPDGRLTFRTSGRNNFVVTEWLGADGDGRDAKDRTLYDGIARDAVGCIGRLRADD